MFQKNCPQSKFEDDVVDRKRLGDELESVIPKTWGKNDRDGGTAIVLRGYFMTGHRLKGPRKGKGRSGRRRT